MATFSDIVRGGYVSIDACDKDQQLLSLICSMDEGLSEDFYDFLSGSNWRFQLELLGFESFYNLADGSQIATVIVPLEKFKALIGDAGEQFQFILDDLESGLEIGTTDLTINFEKDDSVIDF